MAIWDRNKVLPSALNSGNEYVEGDFPTEETLNAANNNAFYAVDYAEALGDTPDTSQVGNIGTPTVTLIDNVKTIDGTPKTFKKFKFANLKGEKGDAGINDALVVQELGTSTDNTISQKIITDNLALKQDKTDSLTAYTAINDADYVPFYDTSETAHRKSLWSNIKSVLKTYFDALYTTALVKMTGYSKAGSIASIATTDTINQAIGKLEYGYESKASKVMFTSLTITNKWTGDSAPYTQDVTVTGMTADDEPHIMPVYSTTLSTAQAQEIAYGMISKAVSGTNKITFTCNFSKPATAIPIEVEVIR